VFPEVFGHLPGFFIFTEFAFRYLSRNLAVFVLIAKKVKPTEFTNDELKDMITGEDGLLKEALKRGDLQEMVEVINAVGSILNFGGRKAAQKNLTGPDAKEEEEARDTRVEVCGTYDSHLLGFLDIFQSRSFASQAKF